MKVATIEEIRERRIEHLVSIFNTALDRNYDGSNEIEIIGGLWFDQNELLMILKDSSVLNAFKLYWNVNTDFSVDYDTKRIDCRFYFRARPPQF